MIEPHVPQVAVVGTRCGVDEVVDNAGLIRKGLQVIQNGDCIWTDKAGRNDPAGKLLPDAIRTGRKRG